MSVPAGHAILWSSFLSIMGMGWFGLGFSRLKLKRLIENTPTSKIRSMAMGQVEIKGQAVDLTTFIAPFSQRQCVYYQYKIQKLVKDKNGSHWSTFESGDTKTVPFYIQDDTGRALINPAGAEIDISDSYDHKATEFSSVPGHIVEFLNARNIEINTFFGGTRELRFIEGILFPGQPVYVLGCCQTNHENLASARRQKLIETLKKLKQNPQLMAKFDQDHDGKISAEEWEVARHVVEEKLMASDPQQESVFVGQGGNQSFLISDKDEKKLVSSFNLSAVGGIWFGPVLAVIGISIFIYSFL